MVMWDHGDVVVQDVCADNVVEEPVVDKADVSVDCGGGSANEVPLLGVVVGEGTVDVVEEGDCHSKGVRIDVGKG